MLEGLIDKDPHVLGYLALLLAFSNLFLLEILERLIRVDDIDESEETCFFVRIQDVFAFLLYLRHFIERDY